MAIRRSGGSEFKRLHTNPAERKALYNPWLWASGQSDNGNHDGGGGAHGGKLPLPYLT